MTDTSPGEAVVASAAILTLGAGIVSFVALGREPAALVLALGWLVVVPLLAILTEAFGPLDVGGGRSLRRARQSEGDRDDETDSALDALRRRYTRGDIDEAEFERRVERLIETEDPEQARDAVVGDLDRDLDGDRETEREL